MGESLKMRRTSGREATVSSVRNVTRKILVAILLCSVIWPVSVCAECKWEWLCDASGQDCQRGAVCDSVHDIMPPPPPLPRPAISPAVPPPPTPGSAPEGSGDCRQVRRCDIAGNCIWDTLCQCL